MASYWKHVYFRETLKRDSDENFKNASDEVSQSAFLNIKVSKLYLIAIFNA